MDHYRYSEDDWVAKVEIVEDRSNEVWERYTLRVIGTEQESIHGPVADGTEYECSQLKRLRGLVFFAGTDKLVRKARLMIATMLSFEPTNGGTPSPNDAPIPDVDGEPPTTPQTGGEAGALLVQAYDSDPDAFLKRFDSFVPPIQARITFAVAAALGRTVGEVDAAWMAARLAV